MVRKGKLVRPMRERVKTAGCRAHKKKGGRRRRPPLETEVRELPYPSISFLYLL